MSQDTTPTNEQEAPKPNLRYPLKTERHHTEATTYAKLGSDACIGDYSHLWFAASPIYDVMPTPGHYEFVVSKEAYQQSFKVERHTDIEGCCNNRAKHIHTVCRVHNEHSDLWASRIAFALNLLHALENGVYVLSCPTDKERDEFRKQRKSIEDEEDKAKGVQS